MEERERERWRIRQAAWKPQERASKAKYLIGTRVQAAQHDSHTTTPRCTHTHTQATPVWLRDSHIITKTHVASASWQFPEVHIWIFNQEEGQEEQRQTPDAQSDGENKTQMRLHSLCSLTEREVRQGTRVMLGYNQTADKKSGPSFLLSAPK